MLSMIRPIEAQTKGFDHIAASAITSRGGRGRNETSIEQVKDIANKRKDYNPNFVVVVTTIIRLSESQLSRTVDAGGYSEVLVSVPLPLGSSKKATTDHSGGFKVGAIRPTVHRSNFIHTSY
jgi:hypothetical protein